MRNRKFLHIESMQFFSLNRIVTILLGVIYFCIPLVFAHLTDLFGFYLPYYPIYSYESVKVMLFLALAFCLCLLFVLQMIPGEKKIRIKALFLILPLSIFISI